MCIMHQNLNMVPCKHFCFLLWYFSCAFLFCSKNGSILVVLSLFCFSEHIHTTTQHKSILENAFGSSKVEDTQYERKTY